MDFFQPNDILKSKNADSSKSKVFEELKEQLELDDHKIEQLMKLLPEFERLNRRFERHEHEMGKMCKSVCKVANSVDDVIFEIIK